MVLVRHLIGGVLRRRRLRQGLTLREVSRDARVSLGYISEIERGQKEASSELLAAICQALDVPLSEVLREVSDEIDRVEAAAAVAAGSTTTPRGVPSRHLKSAPLGVADVVEGPSRGAPDAPADAEAEERTRTRRRRVSRPTLDRAVVDGVPPSVVEKIEPRVVESTRVETARLDGGELVDAAGDVVAAA
jgi:transcriptional regulator with XRE-family HTH domain